MFNSNHIYFYESKTSNKHSLIPIHSLEEWAQAFMPKRNWKPGRSAHALGQFMMEQDGLTKTIHAVKHCLVELMPKEEQDRCIEHSEQLDWLTIDKCIIEKSDRFDDYANPRQQDLVIYGHTTNGRKFKIGCEAKVDEPFGPTIKEAWQKAEQTRQSHPRSRACDRITGLLARFKVSLEGVQSYRYQLLHYMAGTNNEPDMDMTIMLVMVFSADPIWDAKCRQNYDDFKQFVELFGFNEPQTVVCENYRLKPEIARHGFAIYWHVSAK